MRPIARLVTRLQGEGDGLMIGAALIGHNFFKPNTVYEIVEMMGTMLIREIGQSVVAGEGERWADSPIQTHWGADIGYILGCAGKTILLSRDELSNLKKKEDDCERDL